MVAAMGAGRKIGPIAGFVIAGLLLFVVTTAWMYARGVPWWLCAPAGVLIFPLLPVGWHVFAERGRKRDARGRQVAAEVGAHRR